MTKNPRSIGLIYFLTGVILLVIFFAWRSNRSRILSFDAPNSEVLEQLVQKKDIKPIHLKIPKYRVDIDVTEAAIVEGIWQVFPEKASHLDITSGMSGGGKKVICGH